MIADLESIPTTALCKELARRLGEQKAPYVLGQTARKAALGVAGEAIVAEVSSAFGYTPEQLMGRRRFARLARARQVAMSALWQAGFSTMEVGYHFGRDHGTVIHAIRKTRATRT